MPSAVPSSTRSAHRQLARLSRLPAHVVRDMGFDPDKVAAELEGTWDEVEPTRFELR